MDFLRAKGLTAGLLWLRILAGAGIASHGYAKLFTGRMTSFTAAVAAMGFPLPDLFAWAAALSEFAGGAFIVLGLKTRTAAAFVFATMFTAVFVRHGADPFAAKELALAYMTASGALFMTGPGSFSLDAFFKRPRA